MASGSASTLSLIFQISSPIHFWASPIWRRNASVSLLSGGGGATGFGAGAALATPASTSTNATARSQRRRSMMERCGLRAARKPVKSRTQSFEHARERDRLADVVQSADPRHAALDAHPEPRVRYGAEAAEVEVPVDRLARQLMLLDARFEPRQIVLALAAADDLAVPLGRENVDAEGEPRVGRIRLHVERLRRERIAVDHDRPVEFLGQRRLLVAAEVVAPRDRETLRLQALDRLAVRDARERRDDALELRDVAFQHGQLGPSALQHARDDVREETLGERHVVVEIGERHLGLDHPELGQMPARL